MPCPNNSTLVRTPSVRELCKEKAVKYSRIKCVVLKGGARVNCALFAIFNQYIKNSEYYDSDRNS